MNAAVQANTQARPANLRRFNDALAHQKAVDKAYDELETARKKVGPACCAHCTWRWSLAVVAGRVHCCTAGSTCT